MNVILSWKFHGNVKTMVSSQSELSAHVFQTSGPTFISDEMFIFKIHEMFYDIKNQSILCVSDEALKNS